MIKLRGKFITALFCIFALGMIAETFGQTITADVVIADRLRNKDTGGNLQFWERTEDSSNTLRFLYGPLTNGKVDINNQVNTRFRVTGRGSAIWTGNLALGADPALITGASHRMLWYPFKRAFRVGEVTGNQWDDVLPLGGSNIGQYSIAGGINTTASGFASVALGSGTSALSKYATAFGLDTTASGAGSTAMGVSSIAAGEISTAIGNNVLAKAGNSIALGSGAAANPLTNSIDNSLAVGFNSNLATLFVGPSAGVGTTGNVGIGTSDTQKFKLYVNGSTYINGDLVVGGGGRLLYSSDIRLKANVRSIENALGKVLSLKGIVYDWKKETNPEAIATEATEIGFSAQEVEKILPEVVSTNSNGYKAVAYHNITPVLVEAVKEQQKIIDQQRAEIDQLKARMDALMKKFEEK